MPELPEVEVLARHLRPLLQGQTVRGVEVFRNRVLRPTSVRKFQTALRGATFLGLERRGKYLVFSLRRAKGPKPMTLIGHLGMTGHMYVTPSESALPKHTAAVLSLGPRKFVFEDTRYFGRLTLDASPLEQLGPEPLSEEFAIERFKSSLKRSSQAIKIKLLDQSVVAGVGNIYASETLFTARISPKLSARRLSALQVERLRDAIREVLRGAIERGSTLPLDYRGARDGLFYFGSATKDRDSDDERFQVYDRAGLPCLNCNMPIARIVQAARSTFYCPRCQK